MVSPAGRQHGVSGKPGLRLQQVGKHVCLQDLSLLRLATGSIIRERWHIADTTVHAVSALAPMLLAGPGVRCTQNARRLLRLRPCKVQRRGPAAQVHEGIGYLPAASRDVRLAAARARREDAAVAGDGAVREAIALVKQPDIDFTARLASDVDAWLQVSAVNRDRL